MVLFDTDAAALTTATTSRGSSPQGGSTYRIP